MEDDSVSDSQLLRYANAPTQEEKPEGPDPAPEVEEIPPSEPMDGIELQQPAPLRDGQDIIRQEDSFPSPPSVEEIPPGQGDSREVEQGSFQSEPSEQEVRDFAQEMKQRASLLDTLDAITGHSSNSQEVSNRHRGVVGERMLHDWYQPVGGSVWSEHRVFDRLNGLTLAPEYLN